jgi:hypothetical protein
MGLQIGDHRRGDHIATEIDRIELVPIVEIEIGAVEYAAAVRADLIIIV